MLEICARTLRTFGCSPILASTATEALRLLGVESRQVPIAIIDIVLPDMSGLELVRLLRESGYTGQVVCTSGFPPSYIPEPYRGSMKSCFFLQKPFTPRQLYTILCEALGHELEA